MLGLALIVAAVTAQEAGGAALPLVYSIEGRDAEGHLGFALAALPDVDGDGSAELLLGAFGAERGAGAVQVVSGATGATLYAVHGAAGELCGTSLAALGDVDGDGIADWAAGSPGDGGMGLGAGAVRVLSGRDGRELKVLRGEAAGDEFGFSIAGPGDIDGDGVDDLIVGAPGTSRRGFRKGRAVVYSGRGFAALRLWGGDAGEDRLGTVVAAIGDVNADGRADVAVGAPQHLTLRPGYARVYSGGDGLLIGLYGGEKPGDGFGSAIAGVGDLDGDGQGEVAVGASLASENAPAAGSVQVISVHRGAVLYTWRGERAGDRFGASIAAVGDLDGDGTPDVAVGAIQSDQVASGYVRLFSGKSGRELATLRGQGVSAQYGQACLRIASGTDGPRLVVSSSRATPAVPLSGRVDVLRLPVR